MTSTANWVVYIVECIDGSLYTGCTNDLPSRLLRHNAGTGAKYTRSRCPVRLVYSEALKDRSEALKREAAIKKLTRTDKLLLIQELSPNEAYCRCEAQK